MNNEGSIKPGRYRHYKGKDYEVIGCARHSETEEEFVVYRALYGKRGLWVRPLTMFLQAVMVDGKPVPRFQLMSKRMFKKAVQQGRRKDGD